jgi:hypothetical protein
MAVVITSVVGSLLGRVGALLLPNAIMEIEMKDIVRFVPTNTIQLSVEAAKRNDELYDELTAAIPPYAQVFDWCAKSENNASAITVDVEDDCVFVGVVHTRPVLFDRPSGSVC